jgi:3-oxoacyl-[acyl-carrier-protein] synthase II
MTSSSAVAVTGLGIVTSIGTGRRKFWDAILAGRCGFSPVKSFDTRNYSVHVGAEISDFCADDHILELQPASVGRTSQLAIAASRLALEDGSLDLSRVNRDRVGVCVGTTSGEPNAIERFDDQYVQGLIGKVGGEFLKGYPCHVIPLHVASELDLTGEAMMIPTACAAGNYAIAHACDLLCNGKADYMLAGGADSFSRITYAGFARLGAIAPELCQPFDRNRKGMIPGEGAAILLLEPAARASARGASIYCEITGYGFACDAHHMTAAHPEGEGAARAMRLALEHSGLQSSDVDYISAHGTGTLTNDRLETIAVKKALGSYAYTVPISSVKSMLGHTMGAASAIEAAVCALAITHGCIPPTMHWRDRDGECDLDYVANSARKHKVKVAMNNAYAFGGNNSSLILAACSASGS